MADIVDAPRRVPAADDFDIIRVNLERIRKEREEADKQSSGQIIQPASGYESYCGMQTMPSEYIPVEYTSVTNGGSIIESFGGYTKNMANSQDIAKYLLGSRYYFDSLDLDEDDMECIIERDF